MAEKKFNNRTFRSEKVPAKSAAILFFRLTKLAGPLFGSINKLDDETAMLQAFGDLFASVEPEAAGQLLEDILALGEVQDDKGLYSPIIMDYVFQDKLLEACQVAAWILQVNFKDFFTAVGQKSPTIARAVASVK